MYLYVESQKAPMAVIAFGGADLVPVGERDYVMDVSSSADLCRNSPPGIAVHTESGERGSLTINGVTINLESTAFITMQRGEAMRIVNLEGSVSISVSDLGVNMPVPPGYQVAIAMDNGEPVAVAEPSPSSLYDSTVLQWLAVEGLPHVYNSNLSSQACVGKIGIGETIVDENFNPGQECLYHFCAKAGDVVSIKMNATDVSLDPWIDLRLPSGELWSSNNDIDAGDSDSEVCNRGLPATSCDYTIVARPYRNASYGSFALTLNGYSGCVPPAPRCEVVSLGLNLRSGPGAGYPRVGVLAQDTQLQPLEDPAGKDWVQVRVIDSADEGWVSTDGRFLACEPPSVVAAPPPTLPVSPASTPPEEEKDDDERCDKKCSPFGTP